MEPIGTKNAEKPTDPPSIQSKDLLQGGRELRIVHAGETYRLFVTRNNKLILQK